MTGHNTGHGYRYGILGMLRPESIIEDNEIGALDAPRSIPAGAHSQPWYFDGTEYLATNRLNGGIHWISFKEWRV